MLERYTRERQKGQGKKGMFNLEDEEEGLLGGFEDGEALGGLTHGGRSVVDLPGDDFVGMGLGKGDEDEDEMRGNIDRRRVAKGHFGGFEGGEEEQELVSSTTLALLIISLRGRRVKQRSCRKSLQRARSTR
jgi:nucleolar protein 14